MRQSKCGGEQDARSIFDIGENVFNYRYSVNARLEEETNCERFRNETTNIDSIRKNTDISTSSLDYDFLTDGENSYDDGSDDGFNNSTNGSDDTNSEKCQRFRCSACLTKFEVFDEYTCHMKSVLHAFNLRLELYSHKKFDYVPLKEEELDDLLLAVRKGTSNLKSKSEHYDDSSTKNTFGKSQVDILIQSLEHLDANDEQFGKTPIRTSPEPKATMFIMFEVVDKTIEDGHRSRYTYTKKATESEEAEGFDVISDKKLNIYSCLLLNEKESEEDVANLLDKRLVNLIHTGNPLISAGNDDNHRKNIVTMKIDSGVVMSNHSPNKSSFSKCSPQTKQSQGYLWLFLLYRAGYFATSTIDSLSGKTVFSKSTQRYTVRRKQGGSQSSKDNKGSWAKSAGAQLRRYNEQLLKNDISKAFDRIKEYLNGYSFIFVSCPTTLRKELFYKKESEPGYISSTDPRIRYLPFTTYRPTTRETLRCYRELTKYRISSKLTKPFLPDNDEIRVISFPDIYKALKITIDKANGAKNAKPKTSINTTVRNHEASACITMRAVKIVKHDRHQLLKKIIDEELHPGELKMVSNGDNFEPGIKLAQVVYKNNNTTLLHIASRNGSLKCIDLLLKKNADPTVRDSKNRTPFDVAKDKETRHVFMEYRKNDPELSNWDYAHVPSMPIKDIAIKKLTSFKAKRKHRRTKKSGKGIPVEDGNNNFESEISSPSTNMRDAQESTNKPHFELNDLDALDEQQTREYLRRKAFNAFMKRFEKS